MTTPQPFALGTFRTSASDPFAGLVLGSRVIELGPGWATRSPSAP